MEGGWQPAQGNHNSIARLKCENVRKKIVSSHHGLELFKSFRSTLKTVRGIYLDILSFTYLFVGLSRLWLYIQMDISEGLSPDTFGFTAMNKIAIKLDLLQHFYKRFTSNCDNFLWIILSPLLTLALRVTTPHVSPKPLSVPFWPEADRICLRFVLTSCPLSSETCADIPHCLNWS